MATSRRKIAWVGVSVLIVIGGFVSGVQGQSLDLPYTDSVMNINGPAFEILSSHLPIVQWPPVGGGILRSGEPMCSIRGRYSRVDFLLVRDANFVPALPEIVFDPNGSVWAPGFEVVDYNNVGTLGGPNYGVAGIAENGAGIYGKGGAGDYAGKFDGDVLVNGRLFIQTGESRVEIRGGLDYSEGFDVSDDHRIDPGMVLVIDPLSPGKLTISRTPYDTRVAGIIAGAKGLGSGVRLGVGEFDHDVALAGRVYCNVDATRAAVRPGDLLTTAAVPGYAMKVTNHQRARGAILGKAMEGLEKGKKGQILVLVTLQ